MIEQTEEYQAVKQQRDAALVRLRKARLQADRDIERVTTPPPPRILVVDDEPSALRALAFDLAEFTGMEVVTCDDPEEAQRMLAEEDFACIVLDLHLDHPEINGVTLAELVHHGRVKVIVSADENAHAVATGMGALWLDKPYPRRDSDVARPQGDAWVDAPKSASIEQVAREARATQRDSVV